MVLHHRDQDVVLNPRLVLPDQPDLQPGDAKGLADDVVVEVVDDHLVHQPVDILRVLDQRLVAARLRAPDDRLVPLALLGDLLVGRGARIGGRRLLFEEEPELEGVADQVEVDMGDLHAALRHGLDQPFRLQPRDQLADRSERIARHGDELALGDELAGPDLACEQPLGEAGIGPLPKLQRFDVAVRLGLAHQVLLRRLSLG